MPMSFFLIYMLIIWHFKAFEKTHSEMEHPVHAKCTFFLVNRQVGIFRKLTYHFAMRKSKLGTFVNLCFF